MRTLSPLSRRAFLRSLVALPFLSLPFAVKGQAAASTDPPLPINRLRYLEARSGGRLGVCLLRANGSPLAYRGQERFPMCSTFKAVLTAAVLRRSMDEPGLLARPLAIGAEELVSHSPVTRPHAGSVLSVEALCAAAMLQSDNTAANLLMRLLGGPQALGDFTRSLGDTDFRQDRWETECNTALPGDPRDTTTPEAMARTLHTLVLGPALAPAQRQLFITWLKECSTGAMRIPEGAPPGWIVGHKTGSGDNGTSNDIAVLWPPPDMAQGVPLVLTIYLTGSPATAPKRDAIIRSVTTICCEAVL